MKSLPLFLAVIPLSAFAASPDPAPSLGGVQSPRTPTVEKLLQKWKKETPANLQQTLKPTALEVQCLSTPGSETYIGAAQFQRIKASAQAVARALDEVEHYPDLFDDVEKADVRDRKGNRFTVFTEQNIPVPLVPNEKDEVLYLKDSAGTDRIWYRYQLKSSNHLTANDGFILLVRLSKEETAYIEYDFWDADWGMAKSFGVDKLWKSNISSLVQSDLAIKLRAENPGWAFEKVKKESENQRDLLPLDECVRVRHTAE